MIRSPQFIGAGWSAMRQVSVFGALLVAASLLAAPGYNCNAQADNRGEQQPQNDQQQDPESATTASATTKPATTTTVSDNNSPLDWQQHPYQQQLAEDEYLVGAGIADITGPAADINLMGYAKPNQDAGGIHLRQFSRSVVIEDKLGSRMLYINLDNGMISQLLRSHVILLLKQQFGPTMFNETNVMMTATHTHSCPGGFFQYMLYNIPSAGFIQQTLDALSVGILRSVKRAQANLQPARIFLSKGELLDASINRSPSSYANNPASERAAYKHNTDKEMLLLRIVDRQQKPLAMLNWFAVHGTSMNNTNHLISSDNKGYAALLFEREFNPPNTQPGKGKFVAIFAQANEGDVSPNTQGPRCVDSGLPCDSVTSTCGNPPRNEKCIAFGPGRDMFESTKIIAHKQYNKARELFLDEAGSQPVRGPVRHVHQHIDISAQVVPPYESATLLMRARLEKRKSLVAASSRRRQLAAASQNNEGATVPAPNATAPGPFQTCKPALGYSFAAGTTDGPGAFDFQQGDTESTRYWDLVRDFLKRPSPEMIKCHNPKPILLATGQMDFPYMWHPKIVPTQLFMVGQVAIVGLPGEFTTMAGRRVREAVRRALTPGPVGQQTQPVVSSDPLLEDESRSGSKNDDESHKPQQIEVALSGLSNIYTSYITTIEEYEMQRYEGASTIYGPHTLQAYVNQFQRLASKLLSAQPIDDSLKPPDLSSSLFTLKAGVIFDGAQHGTNFGSVLQDVDTSKVYKPLEVVQVSFVAGNPRNDLRQEDSFLYVEQFNATSGGTWTVVATDSSWETKFVWERTNTLFGESRATVLWEIPIEQASGVYRIRHLGAYKSLLQTISSYAGKSAPFKVISRQEEDDPTAANLLESTRLYVELMERQQNLPSGDPSSPMVTGGLQRAAQSMGSANARGRTLTGALLTPFRFLGSLLNARHLLG